MVGVSLTIPRSRLAVIDPYSSADCLHVNSFARKDGCQNNAALSEIQLGRLITRNGLFGMNSRAAPMLQQALMIVRRTGLDAE
jgi:hypothetical protein